MSENNLLLLLAIIGGLIIFALAAYAGKLLKQLKQQRQAQTAANALHKKKHAEHDVKVLDSAVIIVMAMKESQCEYAEGAWRLNVLLDSLKLSENLTEQFPAIVELYEGIKHHSILDERKQLPKKERMMQDVERMRVEAKLTEQIDAELELLHETVLNRKSELNSALTSH